MWVVFATLYKYHGWQYLKILCGLRRIWLIENYSVIFGGVQTNKNTRLSQHKYPIHFLLLKHKGMDKLHFSDSKLVKCYVAGDEQALEILVNKHQQKVYSYIISRVRDEDLANDIFQDVFVKIIQTLKKGQYNEEGKFLPWVLRISHNLVIDHFRREKRMPTISQNQNNEFDIFDVIKDESPSMEAALIWDQIEGDLRKLIDYLPDEQREVLQMRHYAQMSFKEIAEQTNVSINTALGRMRYALINLRKLIEKHKVILTQ
jgi:RNA polymerase sigma-70 factor (ECF subfamily)